jgi:hypothetical protein
MGRAPCCDKANVKRGPWSPEEDAALKTYLETHGTGGNWMALPGKAGLFLSLSLPSFWLFFYATHFNKMCFGVLFIISLFRLTRGNHESKWFSLL